jgi:phosphoglycolate phosphatase
MSLKKITHIVFDHDGTLVDTTNIRRNLYPNMQELLQFLHGEGIKLYVWTARSRRSTEDILTSLGVISFFEDICGGNNAPSKPSPEGIELLLPAVNPENVIVIGDSLGDIIGGHNFGAHCIGAMWGHGDERAREAYLEHGAKESFLNLLDCKQYIEKLIRGE